MQIETEADDAAWVKYQAELQARKESERAKKVAYCDAIVAELNKRTIEQAWSWSFLKGNDGEEYDHVIYLRSMTWPDIGQMQTLYGSDFCAYVIRIFISGNDVEIRMASEALRGSLSAKPTSMASRIMKNLQAAVVSWDGSVEAAKRAKESGRAKENIVRKLAAIADEDQNADRSGVYVGDVYMRIESDSHVYIRGTVDPDTAMAIARLLSKCAKDDGHGS